MQIGIITKSQSLLESSLAHACQVWSTSVSAFISYLVCRMTERMTERQNDHITSALLAESKKENNNNNNNNNNSIEVRMRMHRIYLIYRIQS